MSRFAWKRCRGGGGAGPDCDSCRRNHNIPSFIRPTP